MQVQERLIVPGLGVVILLSAFILGVPVVYKALLGLLGAATVATYFAPPVVQVETRIAIAAVGLLILLIITSTAFWLALLSFAAIGALQFQRRGELQRSPATIAWLSKALSAARARRASAGSRATGESAESPPLANVGALPGFVRLNVAGVGGVILGAVVLVSVFMPWVVFVFSGYGEWVNAGSLTLRAGEELIVLRLSFYALLALGVASIVSIVLPRVVAAIIAVAGLAVTLVSYFYVVAQVGAEAEIAELSDLGVGVMTFPYFGALLVALCFLSMLVLQLVPRWNRSRPNPNAE